MIRFVCFGLFISLSVGDISLLIKEPAKGQREWGKRQETRASREGWYPEKVLCIQPVTGKPPNRVCGLFSKKETTNIAREQLLIREKTGAYTPDFQKLLAPFYLKL